jgi:hypothetical protein
MRRMAFVLVVSGVAAALAVAGCGQTTAATGAPSATTAATTAQPAPLPVGTDGVTLSDGQGTLIWWNGPHAGQLAADFQQNSARIGTYWSLSSETLPGSDGICWMSNGARDHLNVLSDAVDMKTGNSACADFLAHGWRDSGPSAGQGA